MAGKACCMLTPELFLSHRLLDGIWLLANDNGTLKLHPSWLVKSFTKGLGFFNRVAKIAEWEGHHHPDLLLVGWNNVKIDVWTHAIGENHVANKLISDSPATGGLTENDFICCSDQLARNGRSSKKEESFKSIF
ncbi:hypothetical protein HID58_056187 [Brassica napus]|uniref:4a-hydroxytetrahydrobiopterin dehydratase n=1 Tax=Brassica napus TaxID=3708 RepID=A0ABQ8AMW4_BRANA|nr:hypothetical protein HID58_056187 [Brassica napus]